MSKINFADEHDNRIEFYFEHNLSANERCLWDVLLYLAYKRATGIEWPDSFYVPNKLLLGSMPFEGMDTLERVRKSLVNKGLITYKNEENVKSSPIYTLHYLTKEK
ncbi:MAG: hypothetical protein GYA87_01690 [Christensenellaceae bacterium]|nr:hypothetical protein [Christensenellaceae bacterium]